MPPGATRSCSPVWRGCLRDDFRLHGNIEDLRARSCICNHARYRPGAFRLDFEGKSAPFAGEQTGPNSAGYAKGCADRPKSRRPGVPPIFSSSKSDSPACRPWSPAERRRRSCATRRIGPSLAACTGHVRVRSPARRCESPLRSGCASVAAVWTGTADLAAGGTVTCGGTCSRASALKLQIARLVGLVGQFEAAGANRVAADVLQDELARG